MKRIKEMPLFLLAMLLMVAGGVLLLTLPAREFSELENRPLAVWEGTLTESGFDEKVETYLSDHFPGRDALVQLHAALSVLRGDAEQDGVLYGAGGRLIESPVREVTATARMAVDTLTEVRETLALPTALLLIPTSAETAEAALPALYENADQQAVIDALHALDGELQAISSGLSEEGTADMYYRTDHHLTAEGAWLVYTRLCEAWGFTPVEAPRTSVEGFRGSYYARIPSPLVASEAFTVALPEHITLTLDGERQTSLLNEAALTGRNKYGALLSETYAHAVLEGGTGEEALLVLSDSYGNAIVPLLAQHFRRVDVIDPRYFAGVLADVAQEAGSTRVLALYGLNIFSTNRGLALLSIGGE